MIAGSAYSMSTFLAAKMSSKMPRTRNGIRPLVALNTSMQAMAIAKRGQMYGRRKPSKRR